MNYLELLKKLYPMGATAGIKLDIENCRNLNHLLGQPDQTYKIVHVAGTNGKGSVCTKVAASLQKLGFNVGLYTSPHISTYRERIRVNGIMISEEDVARIGQNVLECAEQNEICTTFFEVTTLIALLYFKERNIDWAVLETGLGGRLDATNIVTPQICAITSISLDHTNILGKTLEEIAKEKAGIIKKGIPVVVGYNTPQSLFSEFAKDKNSPFYPVKERGQTTHVENVFVAEKILSVLGFPVEKCVEGLEATPPCRFELHQNGDVILDVAHNPDGLEKLFIRALNLPDKKPIRVVFGLSRMKEVDDCLKVIQNYVKAIHVVSGKNERCLSTEELTEHIPNCQQHVSVGEGVSTAISLARTKGERVIICGSFYIMKEVRETLGIDEPADLDFTNCDFNINEQSIRKSIERTIERALRS